VPDGSMDTPTEVPPDLPMDAVGEAPDDLSADAAVESLPDNPPDVPPGGPMIVAAYTGSGRSPVSTTMMVPAVDGHFYFAAIAESPQGSPERVTGVAGLGLFWIRRGDSQCSGRSEQMLEVWDGLGTPAGSSLVTATFNESPESSVIIVVEAANLSNAASTVFVNTNGVAGACSGGPSTNNYLASITSTAPRFIALGFVVTRGLTNTPGLGFTERAFVTAGTGATVSSLSLIDRVELMPGTVDVVGDLSATTPDWIVAATALD